MFRFQSIFIIFFALLFWQCGTENNLASNYYEDGIYYDETYGGVEYSATTTTDEYLTPTEEGDYYEPGNYTSPYQEQSTSGNFYGDIGYYGSSSPWGWSSGVSMSLGYQWGNSALGFGYDPFYEPSFGYGYGMGWNPYYPYYGYNGFGYGYCPGYGYGYPYDYGYGTGNGNYWDNNKPADVIIRGKKGPRASRTSFGGTQGNTTPRVLKTSKKSELSTTSIKNKSNGSKLRAAQNNSFSNTIVQTQSQRNQQGNANLYNKTKRTFTQTGSQNENMSITPKASNNNWQNQASKIFRSTSEKNATINTTSRTNTGGFINQGGSQSRTRSAQPGIRPSGGATRSTTSGGTPIRRSRR